MEGETLYLRVAPEQSGQRLDRYVTDAVTNLTRSHVQQLIGAGNVLVNQQAAAKAGQTVRTGDQVTVRCPPPQPLNLVPEAIPLTIVYEDADVAVIEKEAGMVVHPAPGHASGTLVHALLARYPDMQIKGDIRPGIVHRLDQDTSGLLVVARNDRAMEALTRQQKARQMSKAYLVVVEGRFKQEEGTIDAPIDRHPTDRLRQAVVAGGRAARSHYRVLEELGAYSLLEVRLETGRTHQIRVHCAHINRPVLGDPLYGRRKARPPGGLQRQFLHACRLGFALPASGEWREFCSPLPPDLAHTLDLLRKAVSTSP